MQVVADTEENQKYSEGPVGQKKIQEEVNSMSLLKEFIKPSLILYKKVSK